MPIAAISFRFMDTTTRGAGRDGRFPTDTVAIGRRPTLVWLPRAPSGGDPDFRGSHNPYPSLGTPQHQPWKRSRRLPPLEGPHSVEEYIAFALADSRHRAARTHGGGGAPGSGGSVCKTLAGDDLPAQNNFKRRQVDRSIALQASQKLPWRGKLETRPRSPNRRRTSRILNWPPLNWRPLTKSARPILNSISFQKSITVTEKRRAITSGHSQSRCDMMKHVAPVNGRVASRSGNLEYRERLDSPAPATCEY